MIKQYKLKELNKNPMMHNKVFCDAADVEELLHKFVQAALDAGADADKLQLGDDND